MEIVKQAISNHPLFGNVKREIAVYDAHISTKFKQIVLEAEVKYFNAETNDQIQNSFVSTLPNLIVNNNDFTTVRAWICYLKTQSSLAISFAYRKNLH